MISTSIEQNLVSVSVLGELTIADFKEFEATILYGVKFQGAVNLLVDLRDMLHFTVDVAWEELKFTRDHKNDFRRVAIVTDDQWIQWSAWINRALSSADIRVFDDFDDASIWLAEAQ